MGGLELSIQAKATGQGARLYGRQDARHHENEKVAEH